MAVGGFDVGCFHPLEAFRAESGEVVFDDSRVGTVASLVLPCGRCVGCRLERAYQWSVRVMHEASLWPVNSFVTLTYSGEVDSSLEYGDFRRFIKRVRRRFAPSVVRFFVAGEYGSEGLRPHWHAALFNCDFSDRYEHVDVDARMYRSPLLESMWTLGNSSVGELTRGSAQYMCRYVVDKVDARELVDKDSGQCLRPEFCRMSLRPGIGYWWFRAFGLSDVFPHDRVIVDGQARGVPRYYEKLLERCSPDLLEEVKESRVLRARARAKRELVEGAPSLESREVVLQARLAMNKRRLK